MNKKSLQPKQKAPVVRPTTTTPPQLFEEQLTDGMGLCQGLTPANAGTQWRHCSFDGNEV